MEVRVLGPVDAVDAGEAIALGGPRPRAIVAVLAVAAGSVSSGRLVEEVWGSVAPPSARATLQSYLSRLRSVLGAERLTNSGGAYALRLAAEELDVARFDRDLAAARAAAADGDLQRAAGRYRAALDAWRGEMAEDLDHGAMLREAAARLAEQRLVATEEWIDVELLAGRHHEVVPELDALAQAHPHRERLHAQRMLALYRADRQADALLAFHDARRRFVDGLGIEPGATLQELQVRILAQDPGLGFSADARDGELPVASAGPAPDDAPVGDEVSDSGQRTGVRPHARNGNLPAPLDTFVGRVSERARIGDLLGDGRLVTLLGAGGCGKTQLGLRVASDVAGRFGGRVWWVELAPHRDAAGLLRAVGAALGIPERPGEGSRLDGIVDRLRQAPQLLVLDNCEQLVDACAELVAELLRSCPGLRILATSREPLDVAGERPWRVPSLEVPPAGAVPDVIRASESARLLAVRAASPRPGFDLDGLTDEELVTVGRICRELDGIPLAIELAAARLGVLSLGELADRLGDRFQVLTSGRRSAPARHRTLEAAIAWSYELLDDGERSLLAALSVFAGGFTFEDVERICAGDPDADGLLDRFTALVDKSLVQRLRDTGGPVRHDLLGTVRSFVAERLEPDRTARLRVRHARHYAALAEQARPELTGSGQVAWLNRLHAEHDNLRQVLTAGGEAASRVAASVWLFWLEFGHAEEGHGWLRDRLLEPGTDDPAILLRLHEGAAQLGMAVGDATAVIGHLDAIEAHAQRLGDRSAAIRCRALLATEAAERGDAPRAIEAIEVARGFVVPTTGAWTRASLEHHAARVALRFGQLDQAAAAYGAAGCGYEAAGDEWGACLARAGAARVARRSGDRELWVRCHRTNLARGLDLTVSSLDFVGLPQDLQGLALAASGAGDHELAMWLLGVASSLRTAVAVNESSEDRDERRQAWDRAVLGLGTDEATAAFDDGWGRTAEAAVRLALERTEGLLEASR